MHLGTTLDYVNKMRILPSEKLFILELYSYGDEIKCASAYHLAQRLDMSPRAMQRIVANLEKAGHIVVTRNKLPDGRIGPNSYELAEKHRHILIVE